MSIRNCTIVTLLAFICVILVGAPAMPAASAEKDAAGNVNLLLRAFVIRGTELARKDDGTLEHLKEFAPSVRTKKVVNGKYTYGYKVNPTDKPFYTAQPPEGWTTPDFDHCTWFPCTAPVYPSYFRQGAHTWSPSPLVAVLLRSTFHVQDPRQAGEIKLTLVYRGGVVVYCNGREVARGHMPEGNLKFDTPALDYPQDAYVCPEGYLLAARKDPLAKETNAKRSRTLEVVLPVKQIKAGVNVVALELHRAPAPEAMWTASLKKRRSRKYFTWNRVGLEKAVLNAADPKAMRTDSPSEGIHVWAAPVIWPFSLTSCGGSLPCDRVLRVDGARNGAFSTQLGVSSGSPLRDLKVEVSDLKGPGVVPASAVEVRYGQQPQPGLYNLRGSKRVLPFDALLEGIPKEIPVFKDAGQSIQNVWLTVNVPRDAKAGTYEGSIRISAEGSEDVEAPLKLTVADWTLPDPIAFSTHVGLVQSPESLALQYKVPLWSEEHWQLIERSFKTLALVGNKEVYITLIRRSHFGNENSMVRWIKKNGSYTHDFSIAERYLDLTVKYLGSKIPVVCLYCWEPAMGSDICIPANPGTRARADMPIRISVLDPETGKMTASSGPTWGTPECRSFWKPVFDGIRQILTKRGLAGSMMVGVSGDFRPSKAAVDDLAAAAPDAKWIMHSHYYARLLPGRQTLVCLSVENPSERRYSKTPLCGWKSQVTSLPRSYSILDGFFLPGCSKLARIYNTAEICLSAWSPHAKTGVCGFARIGADFFPALSSRKGQRGGSSIAGRYFETGAGNISLNLWGPAVLAPGPDGTVSTARFEMLRESLQLGEVRIFIEKALADPAQKKRLGKDLSTLAQNVLDERVRDLLRVRYDRFWFVSSGWQERTRSFFALAAEVQKKLDAQLTALSTGGE